ncbi:saccharopine dehydrogenase family protein [Siminovitchia sp. 179-K 8D1 HS]|uniref:saccharopine dehydrogenase family protein n=1 Tax=Siminovitchia sp. 179-K 8D1 HS TaxID=3142385 RepID=UPI0039A3B0C9
MRAAVLGAGLMGKEAARDLVKGKQVDEVGLADIDRERAEGACRQINSPKLKAFQLDADNPQELVQFLKNYDVVLNALFYSFNEKVVKAAIEAGTSAVDLGGHIGQMTDKVLALHEEAKRADITVIPDLGVAPGMINILSGYGAGKMDSPQSIKLYVGGIPLRPEPPLEYHHVFSLEGLLDHYTDPSMIIRDGKKQEIPSLSEVEPVYFEKFGPLEAFHTSGGTSTLSGSFPELNTLEYKTIRYPGHRDKFKLLVDLHLTRNDHCVQLGEIKVKPRDVLLKVLGPIMELGDRDDVVLLRVVVSGEKDSKRKTFSYEMVTYKDRRENVTAMARATANTISVVAQMIGNGIIQKRGAFPPEQIVPGDLYLKEMAKRKVYIKEAVY